MRQVARRRGPGREESAVIRRDESSPLRVSRCGGAPAQADLSVHDGVLRLSEPPVRPGVHLPVDLFLQSLAHDYGRRTVETHRATVNG
jgi:hypothetical protein